MDLHSAANATAIQNWPDGKFEVRRYGGPPHERGNQAAYNQTGSLAWPVLVMWGPSSNIPKNISGPVDELDFTGAVAKMSCPRAKNATEGSTVPGSVIKSDEPGANAGNREIGLPTLMSISAVLLVGAWIAV